MSFQEVEQGLVQIVEIEDFRSDNDVNVRGKPRADAGPCHIDVPHVNLLLQIVFEHIGPCKKQGHVLHVRGSYMGKAKARGQDGQNSAPCPKLKQAFAGARHLLAQIGFEHKGSGPDLGPQGQILQGILERLCLHQSVQILAHVVDVQNLKNAVVEGQGLEIDLEALSYLAQESLKLVLFLFLSLSIVPVLYHALPSSKNVFCQQGRIPGMHIQGQMCPLRQATR